MSQATFTVKETKKVREGETNGRQWALYEIQGSDGRRYTSFDAAWLLMEGRTVTVDYTTKQNGKFTNYTLGDAPQSQGMTPPPTPPSTAAQTDPARNTEATETLRQILATLERIATHLGVP